MDGSIPDITRKKTAIQLHAQCEADGWLMPMVGIVYNLVLARTLFMDTIFQTLLVTTKGVVPQAVCSHPELMRLPSTHIGNVDLRIRRIMFPGVLR